MFSRGSGSESCGSLPDGACNEFSPAISSPISAGSLVSGRADEDGELCMLEAACKFAARSEKLSAEAFAVLETPSPNHFVTGSKEEHFRSGVAGRVSNSEDSCLVTKGLGSKPTAVECTGLGAIGCDGGACMLMGSPSSESASCMSHSRLQLAECSHGTDTTESRLNTGTSRNKEVPCDDGYEFSTSCPAFLQRQAKMEALLAETDAMMRHSRLVF